MTDTTETDELAPLTAEERAEWLKAMDFLDGCDGCEFTMPESLLRRLGRRTLADLDRKDEEIAALQARLDFAVGSEDTDAFDEQFAEWAEGEGDDG